MRVFTLALAIAISTLAASPLAAANNFIRVPQNSPTLSDAIQKVTDGGIIEMSAGTYPSPPNGFAINNLRKAFTVRAAAGATVVLDGGGVRNLVRMVNVNRGRGKRVTFERITFQNGFSADNNESGGVTLGDAEALFNACSFVGNRTNGPATGGGAVKVLESSSATFVNCSFRDNSSPIRGGAISVREGADVTVQGGEFLRNRVNLPGHRPNSAGGAIYVLDGVLRVSGGFFDGNEAGFAGGAIYAIGNWNKGADVLVTGTTFRNNQAQGDLCCTIADPSTGGAIHAEDLTTMRIHQSLFLLNRAAFGGAVDNYRAVVEINGSVFRGNQTTRAKPTGGAGGAISAFSSDFPDASTQGGVINRPPARLVIAQSLLQGGGEVETAPITGGCILANGDSPRVYGGTGVPLMGTAAQNRATVEIRGSVFLDCDTVTPVADGNGNGGAIAGNMIDLLIEDSMILDSDARGPSSTGGGISLREQSAARIARSTFSRNSAEFWGGAISAVGSTLQVSDSRFFRNRSSMGASILASPSPNPARPENAEGVVSGSIFSDDQGIAIGDVTASGGLNRMIYAGNRFNPTTSGDRVYTNSQQAPNGTNVAGLNSIMASRAGNVAANVRVTSPREGALRAVPTVNNVGAGAPSPTGSGLAYAWVGASASVNGTGLPQPDGLLEVGPGNYSLAVSGTAVASEKVLGTCTAGTFLCLANNRFRAEVVWKNAGVSASARAVALSGDTGYFYFIDPANVELIVKVLDGRTLNGSFWVFYGALSNLEYTLKITDTVTGAVKVYSNPSGRFASVGDTTAFPAPAGLASSLAETTTAGLGENLEELEAVDVISSPATACVPSATALCLAGSRFRLELTWKNAGQTNPGFAVPLSGDTGYFYFLSPSNVEVVVKVLDARSFNNFFWVFYGALSNLEYTMTVTDTQTGRVKTYRNPNGTFASQGDTVALPGP